MCEQLVFGIGELAMIRRVLAIYYGWFEQPDYGTVLLVTVVGTLVCGLTFAILVGGVWQRISLAIWSLVALGEIHHIIETIGAGHYTPGTVTAVPYVAFGFLLMRTVLSEGRASSRSTTIGSSALYLLVVLVLLSLSPSTAAQAPPTQDEFAPGNMPVLRGIGRYCFAQCLGTRRHN